MANIHILAVVASDRGKYPLIFLDEGKRLTSESYMAKKVFPWALANYSTSWIWIQDGDRPHTANVTQEFFEKTGQFPRQGLVATQQL